MYVSMYVIIPIVVNKFCFAFHCLLRLLGFIFIIIFGFLYYFGNLVVYAIRLSFFHFLLLKYICFASLRFFFFFLYYYWNIIVLLLLLIFLLLYSIIQYYLHCSFCFVLLLLLIINRFIYHYLLSILSLDFQLRLYLSVCVRVDECMSVFCVYFGLIVVNKC